MTNQDRANEAHGCLRQLNDYEHNELETNITDLLADLLHLCKINDINFDTRMASARMHFDAEINGE
jgi:hypothetical protein